MKKTKTIAKYSFELLTAPHDTNPMFPPKGVKMKDIEEIVKPLKITQKPQINSEEMTTNY